MVKIINASALFLMLSFSVSGQNLTGIWSGKRTQIKGGCYPEYTIEIHIYYCKDNVLMGNAYNYFDKEHFTKINFTGRFNPLTKRLVILENAVVQFQVPSDCITCIKTYDLNWTNDGKREIMEGDWKGHEMGNSNPCPPGKINLEKVDKAVFPVEVYQDDSMKALQEKMKIGSREKDLFQSFELDTSELKIELYDNAEIDGDTVSILMNNTLVLYRKMLTDKPLQLNFTAFPNTDYEFMMYAENLGKIPPNTSLMVITAGSKRYELRIASSDKKSAVVHFRYKK